MPALLALLQLHSRMVGTACSSSNVFKVIPGANTTKPMPFLPHSHCQYTNVLLHAHTRLSTVHHCTGHAAALHDTTQQTNDEARQGSRKPQHVLHNNIHSSRTRQSSRGANGCYHAHLPDLMGSTAAQECHQI